MLKWDTAWRALREAAGLPGLRFHDLRHMVITELAEMGVADHVFESISGHLSRRMLEHYSHIRIDAKRQALDALDAAGARQRIMAVAMGTRKPDSDPGDRGGQRRPHVTVTSQFGFAWIAACR
jgi:Phage integrase family